MPTDQLFEVRNFFILGNYQAAINEATSLSSEDLNESECIERDVYVYRSYIGQGNFDLVLNEVKLSAPTPLQVVKLLATFLRNVDNRDIALVTLKEWLNDGVAATNPILQVIAGLIYFEMGNLEEAMRCVYQGTSLEGLSILIQIYLRINRLDQAEKELARMHKVDEDATITQLTTAWVHLFSGGDRVKEALSIFQDLSDKFGATGTLLNCLALCNLQLRKYPEAEKLLLQALEKRASDPDTLINLITCYQHQGKGQDVIARYINQLRVTSPKHPWLVDYQKVENSFDFLSAQHKIN